MQDMVKTNGMAKTLSAKFQNMSKITKEASPPSAGKRKNVTQACTICRSKKTKVSLAYLRFASKNEGSR